MQGENGRGEKGSGLKKEAERGGSVWLRERTGEEVAGAGTARTVGSGLSKSVLGVLDVGEGGGICRAWSGRFDGEGAAL